LSSFSSLIPELIPVSSIPVSPHEYGKDFPFKFAAVKQLAEVTFVPAHPPLHILSSEYGSVFQETLGKRRQRGLRRKPMKWIISSLRNWGARLTFGICGPNPITTRHGTPTSKINWRNACTKWFAVAMSIWRRRNRTSQRIGSLPTGSTSTPTSLLRTKPRCISFRPPREK
jgi:hypothetical protein